MKQRKGDQNMAKSKLVEANEKIAEEVVGGYKKIEERVVSGYKKSRRVQLADSIKSQINSLITF